MQKLLAAYVSNNHQGATEWLPALSTPEDERPGPGVHIRTMFISTTDTGSGEEAKQRKLPLKGRCARRELVKLTEPRLLLLSRFYRVLTYIIPDARSPMAHARQNHW